VIVKRLSSVQDLGSVNLLCTDKTGTITENRLVHQGDYMNPDSRFHPLLLARLAAHGLKERSPEPFDRATDEALTPEQRKELEAFKILQEEAFDPALRSNGAIVSLKDGSQLHIRRGSPEYFFDQGLVNRDRLGSWLEEEENHGRRVLGVSYDDGSGPRFNLLFEFTMPTLDHLALIMGLAVLYLIASEVVKRPIARFLNKDQ
jgi:Mg2+-importing ATPase